MAWNEPGNGKDRDPWGGGNNNDGPPDLDELFKKAQDSLSGLFGGKGGKGGSGGGNGGEPVNPAPFIGIAGIILAFILVWTSAYQVEQAEQAVVLRTGKFLGIEGAGLHFKVPFIDEVMKVNVQAVRQMQIQVSMLTADNNIVDIAMAVQYQVADPKAYLLEVSQPVEGLHHATESAMRTVVGGMRMDAVLTEQRQEVAILVKEQLQESLDRYKFGIIVSEVSMQDANAPEQVKAAFDDVNKAKEDEERVINEAQAYANKIIPEARGFATRQLEEAKGYKASVIAQAEGESERFEKLLVEYRRAPQVTRKRLYIETMENVLSNSTKILVDVEGGNNLLYLPLDRLMNQSGSYEDNLRNIGNAVNDTAKSVNENTKLRGSDRLRKYRDRQGVK